MVEPASTTPLDGHDRSNFRTAVGKLIFMAPWSPAMQFAIQQLSTQVLNPTTESKRAVKQLIRYLKGTQHTCPRLEPRGMVQKGLLELVGRSDSDCAGDSATHQRYHCDVQNVTLCNRSLKQTAIILSAKQSCTQPQSVLAWENCWDSQNSSRNFTTTFQFVSRWTHTRQDTFYSAGDQADSNTSKYDAWQYNSGYERRVYLSVEWTRRTTLQISSPNIWMDRETQSLARKLGLRGVSILSFNS